MNDTNVQSSQISAYISGYHFPTDTMPVEGLPKTLEILLSSLLQENNMQSWQIFQEKSGSIMLKVRFNVGDVPHEQPLSYRRKSPAQTRRDHARAASHRSTVAHKSPCNSVSSVTAPPSGMITRSRAIRSHSPEDSVEGFRADPAATPSVDLSASDLGLESSGLSPTRFENSLLCPTASPFVPDVMCTESISVDPDINPTHITHEETLTISSPPRSSHVTDTDSSNSDPPDSDENTDAETMSREIGRCTCSHCDYGSNYDKTKDKCDNVHYHCDRCSTSKSISRICVHCYKHGAHKRHTKYMMLRENNT